MSEIKFFSKIDRNKDGHVASDLPSWMMQAQLKDLQEEVAVTERMIERGQFELDQVPYVKAELRKKRERLEAILKSKPKIAAKDKDRLSEAAKELESEIKSSNFNYSDMMTGDADAHEEARRLSEDCIKVPGDLAEMCDIPLRDGKTNRSQAIRAWRIARGYLGESADPRTLTPKK